MRFALLLVVVLVAWPRQTHAASILTNGNLDLTEAVEIVPGFFLPKPTDWINEGSRAIAGPYEGELSSEPWAGPAPTPVTTDGAANPPHPEGCGGDDCGVFFKAFTGSIADGAATGHLYQDNAATPGLTYLLEGWAGAEANYLASQSLFAIDFFDGLSAPLGGSSLDLVAAGLFVDNGEPFDYKKYSLMAVAPAGTAIVRARVSMIGGLINPIGGGQAFVVDDFSLTVVDRTVPEPGTGLLFGAGLATAACARLRQRSRRR